MELRCNIFAVHIFYILLTIGVNLYYNLIIERCFF